LACTLSAFAAACHPSEPVDALPYPAVIRSIEAALADRACVKPLRQWARFYRFATDKDLKQDKDKVAFHYQEAGYDGFRSGIYRRPSERGFVIDDNEYRFAQGVYSVSSGKLDLDFCGQNLPPSNR